jgi:hypothetical protein
MDEQTKMCGLLFRCRGFSPEDAESGDKVDTSMRAGALN